MPEFTEDFLVYPRMIDLAACVCEELIKRGLPAACQCGVEPGTLVAFERCVCKDGNGQAWTRMAGAYPSTNFPNQNAALTCIPNLAFIIEVGIVRCVPINPDAQPLSVEQKLNVTRLQMADMAAMLAAIRCCMGKQNVVDDDLQYVVGTYTPIAVQGGVVGGTWQVTVTQGVRQPI